MKAFYWEVKPPLEDGNGYFGVALAANLTELFWVIDWSLDPYAVRFVELKGRNLFEFYGNPRSGRRGGEYNMRQSMIAGEIEQNITQWREFTDEGRSRSITTKEKT